MSRFWISWYEPSADSDGDYRPIYDPSIGLPESIRGWWCTGLGGEDLDEATIVAAIDADNEISAREIASQFWNPGEWRFCELVGDDFVPNDRFPIGEHQHYHEEIKRIDTSEGE